MIKAIQTTYSGHKFRSRLEARWAVAFNAMGIAWQYEPEGFHVEPGGWKYLPDFYLPESRLWVEIKGDWSAETDDYFRMLFWLAEGGSPLPHMSESADSETGGLLLLGPIPAENKYAAMHPVLRNHKGPCIEWTTICHDEWRLPHCDSDVLTVEEMKKRRCKQHFDSDFNNMAEKAFRIARMARFEFGETPKC